EIARSRVSDAALELDFGDLHLRANGSLGRSGDRLRFSARAGSLGRWQARLSGALRAEGELRGGWSDARLGVIADVSGERLGWNGRATIENANARVELPDLDAGRLAVDLDAHEL